MDFNMELLKAFWKKQSEGWRELKNNETRDSHSPMCSHLLCYDKWFPEGEPAPEPRLNLEYVIDENGVVTMKNAKALGGTFMHESIQGSVIPHDDCLGTEELVTRTIMDKLLGITFLQSGHVDVDYIDSTTGKEVKTIVDIKTVGIYVFPGITGQRNAPKHGYTYWKRIESIAQGNEYAIFRQVPYFYILWISRDEWAWKLERFETDVKLHHGIISKLANVNKALLDSENEGRHILPKFEGIGFCDLGKTGNQCYCRHRKGGTTDKNFPEESGANCPGRLKLKQALEHQDLLKIAKEAQDFEGDY